MTKFSTAAAGVVLALVATVNEASAFAGPKKSNTVTISGDRGGRVIQYALQAKRLQKSDRQVRFAGRCESACTLYLGLPRRLTCITPRASFGFHLPYGASENGNRVAASYMIRSYPGWVRNWIAAQGGLSDNLKTMSYSYAKKYLPSCSEGNLGGGKSS